MVGYRCGLNVVNYQKKKKVEALRTIFERQLLLESHPIFERFLDDIIPKCLSSATDPNTERTPNRHPHFQIHRPPVQHINFEQVLVEVIYYCVLETALCKLRTATYLCTLVERNRTLPHPSTERVRFDREAEFEVERRTWRVVGQIVERRWALTG